MMKKILAVALITGATFASSINSINPPPCFVNGYKFGYKFGYNQGIKAVSDLKDITTLLSEYLTALKILKENGAVKKDGGKVEIVLEIPASKVGEFSFLAKAVELYKRKEKQLNQVEIGGWIVMLPTENLSGPQIGWVFFRAMQAGVSPIVKGNMIIFGVFDRKADAIALANSLKTVGINAKVIQKL